MSQTNLTAGYVTRNRTRIGNSNFTTNVTNGVATAEIILTCQSNTRTAFAPHVTHVRSSAVNSAWDTLGRIFTLKM